MGGHLEIALRSHGDGMISQAGSPRHEQMTAWAEPGDARHPHARPLWTATVGYRA